MTKTKKTGPWYNILQVFANIHFFTDKSFEMYLLIDVCVLGPDNPNGYL